MEHVHARIIKKREVKKMLGIIFSFIFALVGTLLVNKYCFRYPVKHVFFSFGLGVLFYISYILLWMLTR